jgi:hypothetical protein
MAKFTVYYSTKHAYKVEVTADNANAAEALVWNDNFDPSKAIPIDIDQSFEVIEVHAPDGMPVTDYEKIY